MIEFLIACSPVIITPGMFGPPSGLKANCGPGDVEIVEIVENVEERKESKVKIPTKYLTIVDWKIKL